MCMHVEGVHGCEKATAYAVAQAPLRDNTSHHSHERFREAHRMPFGHNPSPVDTVMKAGRTERFFLTMQRFTIHHRLRTGLRSPAHMWETNTTLLIMLHESNSPPKNLNKESLRL